MLGRLLIIVLLFSSFANAQSVFGKWKTIDDKSGIEKAVVEIYERGGKAYGKVVKILEEGRENELCNKCKGDDKGKPIVGITVIKEMEENDKGEFKGGKVFDPEYGIEVRGKIWLDPDNPNSLKVRGYLAFLYRTQTWVRIKS